MTQVEFYCHDVKVEREERTFVCTVRGVEEYRTGSYLLAKAWFYQALRSVVMV